ncbi:unnamed protein product [Didymodactylos carnosus]|uniref:Glutamine amidotransferase type-2 domain-containing protein n=1 Tax=Didymodactylos carnosus TaxID=1234261 RepID=A0A8S2I3L0_9BILA|nr:unnamed protein product [Didymodactylos carnosus]CAF3709506.1 unnamed protein product [Didymodactylos carnosus]
MILILNRRGPDIQQQLQSIEIVPNFYVTFAVSVLCLRGHTQMQPFIDENGNIFLWNGEIYNGIQVKPEENDGEVLFNYLKQCTNLEQIRQVFITLDGCYAFIYFQKQTNTFYYGRDPLGRRSLLSHSLSSINDNIRLIISSVRLNLSESKTSLMYNELDAGIIYTCQVKSNQTFEFDELLFRTLTVKMDYPISDSISSLNDIVDSEQFQTVSETYYSLLRSAVECRVTNLPTLCRQCKRDYMKNELNYKVNLRLKNSCPHSKLAILFSGGLDSSVLAAIADQFMPENEQIDLLNVAFYPDLSNKTTTVPPPDRQTGLQALMELNTNRKWNFVQIDVDLNELKCLRDEIIKDVIYPCSTVLDDSIGSALWFAARGIGWIDKQLYESTAEVLLSGLGADEQLAGYSRHRTTFRKSSWNGLKIELEMEMERIAKRNLGRDDRVISSLGKEVRFPFLDEKIVSYLQTVPVWLKV